jgi:hypothetical protein
LEDMVSTLEVRQRLLVLALVYVLIFNKKR